MIYIIGSGLTGISAAVALVKRGYRPTILDTGVQADPEVLALKTRMASLEPEAWSADDLARLRRIGPPASSGIPQKLHFGSNFAYRDVDRATSAQSREASILRSFALGGFSNVWGAVIQPLAEKELQGWPVDYRKLTEHYAHVRNLINPSVAPVQPSLQARELHNDMTRHRSELESAGIRFQYAELAVRSADEEAGKGCRRCGLCLYGCPYDSIFSAAAQLSRMVARGEVSYVPNVLVDRVSMVNDRVRIETRCPTDNAVRIFEGQRVFLAAGLLESTRVVLNSTATTSVPLRVQQSDIFTIPLLRYRSTPDAGRERIHTLCQSILEISDSAISTQTVQLQLYGYNDLYSQIAARKLGLLAYPLKGLIRAVSERLMVAFGYLHSDLSSSIRITRTDGERGKLRLEGQLNEQSKRAGHAIVRKLFRMRKYFQTVPVPMQTRFDAPGGGHRSGGCFPMRKEPVGLETDPWGRIAGLPGVHIIDSSVLPAIPAGPVAFTVMANAHRIASECPIRDAA